MKKLSRFLSLGFLAALLCGAGCVTSRLVEDTRVPEITVDAFGAVTFNDRRVELSNLAKTVKAAGITREQEVNILVPDNFSELLRKRIYAEMLRYGYTRTIFVTNRKATSATVEKRP
ncbi:MAG: hypothetical protein LBW77_00120 [Verrucomicrobiota bacterium]|jgi:hypothetical protein|nr:hypothetical protein [Verrucomicrobiota bacterium]